MSGSRIAEFLEWAATQDVGQGEGVWLVTGSDNALGPAKTEALIEKFNREHPHKVWVALSCDDEGNDHYLGGVFDSAEKAARYEANGWGIDIDEATVE